MYFIKKNLILIFLLSAFNLYANGIDLIIKRSGETLFYSKTKPNIPLKLIITSNESGGEILSQYIGRKQSLLARSLKSGFYTIKLIPDIVTNVYKPSAYKIEITDVASRIEIFIYPAKKENRYIDDMNLFSMATGTQINKDLEITNILNGYFVARGIEQVPLNKSKSIISKPNIEIKILKLKNLLDKELISKEVYENEVEKILNEDL
tara:strand:+ start:2113 stop:2733 length:621 start_codon:yes stop_codon:yes gene_type:complete